MAYDALLSYSAANEDRIRQRPIRKSIHPARRLEESAPARHGWSVEASPSLIARAFEFAVAVLGNIWGLWGLLSTATPLLAEFAAAFMSDDARAKVERRLPSTPAHRRAAFAALGAIGLAIAAFQAFDETNEKLRAAQAEIAQLKMELVQLKSGGTVQHQNTEAARRQAYVVGQLSKFHGQALELWGTDITREQFPRWAQLQDAFVAEASKWVEDNLGVAARERFLARVPFPKVSAFRLVDPSQRERLELLDSIASNIPDLMRDFAMPRPEPSPAATPSLQWPPSPATGTQR